MTATNVDVWPRILDVIRADIGDARYDLWFRNTAIHRTLDDAIEIGAPNLFIAAWLENHFRAAVLRAVQAHEPRIERVRFVVAPALFQESRERQNAELAELVRAASAESPAEEGGAHRRGRVRHDYTFANFIVGACNRLAHASAMEVVANPRPAFNLLFLHSHCGMGKTHLLQAVWHALRQAGDQRRAEYISAEAFTNEFTYAMRHGRLDAFRHKYRRVDMLLIDDVHFFNNKTALQEELLHTFDALDSAHRQILLASDAHPNSMGTLRKGLVSRFLSGMVVRLEAPDYETRLEIIRRQVGRLRKQLDDDVLAFIAARFDDNIRELQGAVHTALAYAALGNGALDAATVRELFLGQPREREKPAPLERIIAAVGEEFRVTPQELRGRKRTRSITLPRQLCLYLGRRLTTLSCSELAAAFGSKHHTSVLFAEKQIRDRLAADQDLAARAGAIEMRLRAER